MTQLSIIIALIAALAFGSVAADGGTATQTTHKPPNPVQHSE